MSEYFGEEKQIFKFIPKEDMTAEDLAYYYAVSVVNYVGPEENKESSTR